MQLCLSSFFNKFCCLVFQGFLRSSKNDPKLQINHIFQSPLPRKNIICTSKMRLYCSSTAKKVQNQISPGRILRVHQKSVCTLPLQQKKSTKSNLPRMNITCTSKMRLNTHSVRTSKMRAIL